MKKILVLLTAASSLVLTSCNQEVSTSRPSLELALAHQGSDGFEVCLINRGGRAISLRVNRGDFEGFFEYYEDGSIVAKAYPEEYEKRLTTSIWENPTYTLKKNEKICWKISGSELNPEVVGGREHKDDLGDKIVAVCGGLYVQRGKEMESVDLRSNAVSAE